MTSISEDPGACAVIKASASSSVKSSWSARTSVSESESLRLTRGSARSRRVARMTCSERGRASSPCDDQPELGGIQQVGVVDDQDLLRGAVVARADLGQGLA